jgi:hypothetical protein
LIIRWNIAPIFPVRMEAMPNAIPIYDKISVIVHAHPFPFHKPYAITKYAIPIAMRAAPIPADRISSSAINGAAITAVIPLKRDPRPPIMASIAIIVTPSGRSFVVVLAVLSQS